MVKYCVVFANNNFFIWTLLLKIGQRRPHCVKLNVGTGINENLYKNLKSIDILLHENKLQDHN